MRTMIASALVATFVIYPAAAGDLGKCSRKDLSGSWRLLVTFRPHTIGIRPEYWCDVRIASTGGVELETCSELYNGEEKIVAISGSFRIHSDCTALANLVITKERFQQATEKMKIEAFVSADRSRMTGIYSSSLQSDGSDYQGRIEAVRRP